MSRTAAAEYAARVEAATAQRARIRGAYPEDRWGGPRTRRTDPRDPRRPLDANLAAVAALVEPSDTVIDVGGGPGRVALPLALRCREMICVDPLAAMRELFEASAASAGIANARFVQADWLDAQRMAGDVCLTANVTYFVRDIVRFVEKLEAAARRRVIITVWSVPPPNQEARLFELVFGEPLAPLPGHRELLPVLWDMGILPDVRVLPPPGIDVRGLPRTRAEAVQRAVAALWRDDAEHDPDPIESRFDELFAETPDGFRPLFLPDVHELLITWELGHA